MYCKRCGAKLDDDARFCPCCGCAVDHASQGLESDGPFASRDSGADNSKAGQAQQGQNSQYGQNPYQQAPPQGGCWQQPPYPYYPPYPAENPHDAKSGGYAALCFFFPLVGLILFLVWNDTYPLRAKSCGKGALAGVITYVAIVFVTFVIVYVSVCIAIETMAVPAALMML